MAVWAFPFVSANGDRAYGPADWMQFYANIFSTGIVPNTGLPGYTGFQVVQTDTPSLNINVGPGVAIIKGGQIMNTAPKSFQIPAPLTSQSRTDSLVIQWNNSSRSGDIIYKTNSIQVIQTADVYELQIATIVVPANASSIAQSNITDTRADTKVCGYSTPYESIKTGDLLAQFKSELEANGVVFSDWFDNIKGQLSEDAAGNLQNQINDSVHNAGNISTGTDLNDIKGAGYYQIGGLVGGTDVLNTPSEVNGIRFYAFLIVIGSLQELTVYSPKQDTTWTYSRSISGSPATWSIWSKTVMADENGKTSVKDLAVTGDFLERTATTTISGPYAVSCTLRRTGNLVELVSERKVIGSPTGHEQSDAGISFPSGYRPISRALAKFELNNGNTLYNPMILRIDSNGSSYLTNEAYSGNRYAQSYATWVTNDPWPAN